MSRYAMKASITTLTTLFAIALLSAWVPATAQRMYDSSGHQIGRVDGERYYDSSGRQIGRVDGTRIYDASGRQLGRLEGDRIVDSSGSQIGRIDGERLFSASGTSMLSRRHAGMRWLPPWI